MSMVVIALASLPLLLEALSQWREGHDYLLGREALQRRLYKAPSIASSFPNGVVSPFGYYMYLDAVLPTT